jgi:hypothetical protein
MTIHVQNYFLSHFWNLKTNGTIKLSPEIQRRAVWPVKTKMMLIDSLVRGVPVGAITLYKDESQKHAVWEVIDGKQRLTALFDFMEDKFEVDASVIARNEEAEITLIGADLAAELHGKPYSNLSFSIKQLLQQYLIPVFEISGDRDQAVQAFTRMNRNSYVLKPQEIRNAVYAGSQFLTTCDQLSTDLASLMTTDEPGLVQLGIIGKESFDRMQDIQFIGELMILAMRGESNRRDLLNEYCETHASPAGDAKKSLNRAQKSVWTFFLQLTTIFEQTKLSAFHFPPNCEDDVYALAGALFSRGFFTEPQLKKYSKDIGDCLSEFRRQVALYLAALENRSATSGFSEVVQNYATTMISGQKNSEARRLERRICIEKVLNEVADAPTASGFTSLQRDLIWAKSEEKTCGRCGEVVKHIDYQAGHIKPKSDGGLPLVDNGRIEHKECNLKAGADLG